MNNARLFWGPLLLVPALGLAGTIIEPSPVVSTVCTVAQVAVACGPAYQPKFYGTENVAAGASISILGLNTADGLDIEAGAGATAGTTSRDDLGVGSSAIAFVFLDFFGSTDGPARQGFATFAIVSDHDQDGGAVGLASSFIAGLGSCEGTLCMTGATLVPFELGMPFEIGLSLRAASGVGPHVLDGAGTSAVIQLRLFETSGDPVVIFDPPGPSVPEPGSWVLSALGILTFLIFRAKAISTRQP